MKRFFFTFVLIFSLGFVLGMSMPDIESSKSSKPIVVSTVGMINDIVKNISAGMVDNKLLLPAGTDPHVHIPSLRDVSLFNSADVILAIGLDLEAQMRSALDSLAQEKTVVYLGETLDPNSLIAVDENLYDPHVWFDLDLFSQLAIQVSQTLTQLMPEHSETFQLGLDSYLSELRDLNTYAESKLFQIPESQRWLITTHDAFSYFARKYDFNIFTLQGVSTESDYSLKDKNDMIDIIIENKIPAVFVEDSVSNRDLLSVIDQASEGSESVQIGGYLYADSLGPQGSPYESFKESFKSNVDIISNALN